MNRHNTIAIIFDFDDTLAEDSTSSFLASMGVDVKKFWRAQLDYLKEGWDPVPCYLQRMVDESVARPVAKKITKRRLAEFGKKIKFHKGVKEIFGRIKKQVAAISPEISVEFFVISSGIGEILRNTSISKCFTDIFASDFHYNEKGEIVCPKNIVSFTDKTRFIFQIQKGLLGKSARLDPFAVNKKVPSDKLHIPLDQMIVIGDGFTDVPCFSLIQKNNGIAIGVYNRESRDKWGKAWGFIEDHRVTHLVAADYHKNSGLDDALSIGLDTIARRIKLKSMTYQG